jgi:hypothetical protein
MSVGNAVGIVTRSWKISDRGRRLRQGDLCSYNETGSQSIMLGVTSTKNVAARGRCIHILRCNSPQFLKAFDVAAVFTYCVTTHPSS